jgi:branched-subunit amino acid aminotransferase/4-amino-4-deoxychorismate lyase
VGRALGHDVATSSRLGVSSRVRIEIDGRRAGAEAVWSTASAYGHFTAMQVRGRRTRGLALHLRRLEAATNELFEVGLDRERVRELIRHALREIEDASVRVYVFESDEEPAIMVTVKEPGGVSSPQRLQSVRYQRPDPHIKHLATGQAFYSRLARRNGFDDALLTAPDGIISESSIANIGFFDGSTVVWPDAPLLHGITMQLLEHQLPEFGVPSRRAPVRLQDITSFEGAFLSNARGVAAVSQVDGASLPIPAERMKTIADAYASATWDSI